MFVCLFVYNVFVSFVFSSEGIKGFTISCCQICVPRHVFRHFSIAYRRVYYGGTERHRETYPEF